MQPRNIDDSQKKSERSQQEASAKESRDFTRSEQVSRNSQEVESSSSSDQDISPDQGSSFDLIRKSGQNEARTSGSSYSLVYEASSLPEQVAGHIRLQDPNGKYHRLPIGNLLVAINLRMQWRGMWNRNYPDHFLSADELKSLLYFPDNITGVWMNIEKSISQDK